MFSSSAHLYDAIYSWKDYAAEVHRITDLIEELHPEAKTLLDVACGTGKHLELLREHYEVEGLDLDPNLLRAAAERNPGVELHEGDMTSFDLGKTFDVVTCLFSSIAYVETIENLRRATGSLAEHLVPGGLLIVEPFFPPSEFRPGDPWALFVDEPDLKIARMDLPAVEGRVGLLRFHYLVATSDGIDHFEEEHRVGLFTHEDHLEAFERAGLKVSHDPEGLMGRGLYVATKPAV